MNSSVLDRARPAERGGPGSNAPGAGDSGCFISPEEYLARERDNEFKSEYVDGEMIAMPGASWNHSTIKDNLAAELRAAFKGGPCRVVTSDMRVWIPATDGYFYPDVVIVCTEPQLKDGKRDNLVNPTAVVEVLSPTTERFDRGLKFERYGSTDSLREYFLIAQDRVRIERFTRQPDGTWAGVVFDDPQGKLEFGSVPVEISIREIYDRVKFEESAADENL